MRLPTVVQYDGRSRRARRVIVPLVTGAGTGVIQQELRWWCRAVPCTLGSRAGQGRGAGCTSKWYDMIASDRPPHTWCSFFLTSLCLS